MFLAPEHNAAALSPTRYLSINKPDNSYTGETMWSPDSGRQVGIGNLRSNELVNFRTISRKATAKLVTAPAATAVISARKYRCCHSTEEMWPVWPPRLVALARCKSFVVAFTAAATSSIWTTLSPASVGNDHLCSPEEALNKRSSDTAAMNSTAASEYRPHVSVLVPPREMKIKEKARTSRVLKMKRGASSFFSRMTAAIALIGPALLSSHGVGASSIAEETCTGVTLYYTELELEASPRPDTSTEAVAAGIDGTVIASQFTYDRLLLDREAIAEMSEVDVPFRNRWSDRLWLGTVKVTFTGAATLANLEEGSPPDFNCMEEHYGMSFVKGDAGSDIAEGTLTSEKVLNWDLLELEYMSIEGITGFEPTSELVVRSTTNLVATREDLVPGGGRNGSYHYFLSVPSSEVDQSTCPDPCTGEIITYYWSYTGGNVYELDKTSTDADPPACWLSVFEEVSDGPPFGGPTSWNLNCTTTLLNRVEKEHTSQIFDESHSGDASSSEAIAAVAAGVLVPTVLVACIGVVILLQRRQKARKMRTTDEAWGEGRDGWSRQQKAPGPLTGKLGVEPIDGGDKSPTLGPPTRAFTDISIESEEFERGQRSQSDCCSEAQLEREDTGSEDMVYTLDV